MVGLGDIRGWAIRPEYTGENRCTPCTIVNVLIAMLGAALLGWVWIPLGVGFLVVSVFAIWLRGYLVPGTPTLTRRYLPPSLLAFFEKESLPADAGPVDRIDVEATLLIAGVIEPCEAEDDLCLGAAYREAWYETMAEIAAREDKRAQLAPTLGYDQDEVSFIEHREAFVGKVDDTHIGQWESEAALTADLATLRELPRWLDGWDRLAVSARRQLMAGLRVFLDRCPACGGTVSVGQEVTESCCRSRDVVVARCQSCSTRLLERPHRESAGT